MARKRDDRQGRRNSRINDEQYFQPLDSQMSQQQYYQQPDNGRQQYYQQPGNGRQQYYQQQGNGQQQYYQQQGNGQQQYYQQPGGQPYYQDQYYRQTYTQPPLKKKRRTGRKVALFVFEVILLVVLAVVLYVAAQLSKMEKVEIEEQQIEQKVQQQLPEQVVKKLKGYWNIALFGVDSREGSTTSALSDAIMVASINRDTKEVKLVSVYRDTYLDNTNGDYRKATECYLMGGPERAINMLNKNLDLDITNFLTVNMNVLAEVVDSIGGVEIDVREDEVIHLNNYQVEGSEITGKDIINIGPGLQTLNGLQALSYCRIRYTEPIDEERPGLDYERAIRQRRVLDKILEKVKHMDVLSLTQMVQNLLPYVSTNLTELQLLDLAKDITAYNLVDTAGFPYEKEAVQMQGDIVVPVNLAANVSQLHDYLFGSTGYEPSATVQEISDTIANATGIY